VTTTISSPPTSRGTLVPPGDVPATTWLPAGSPRYLWAVWGFMIGLAQLGAGSTLGLGDRWAELDIVRRNPWLR